MDGHTTGSPQGAGGQNPAYRPAHRHPPVRTLESWAFVTDSRLVARCRAGLLSAGQRRGKRTPGALGVESPTPKGVRDEGTPASTRNRGTEYGRAQGEPSYVLLPRTSFDVHRLGWSVFGQTYPSHIYVRGLVAEASVAPWSVLVSASAAPIGLQPLGAAGLSNRTVLVGAVG